MRVAVSDSPAACDDIPLPIVSLNRWTLLVGIVAGFVLQQPLFTTLLFLILLPAVPAGRGFWGLGACERVERLVVQANDPGWWSVL